MLKTLASEFLPSLYRTVAIMPIVFFWWSLATVMIMGTGQWLDWMHGFFVVRENLELAVTYLAIVSWLFSVLFFTRGSMSSARMMKAVAAGKYPAEHAKAANPS